MELVEFWGKYIKWGGGHNYIGGGGDEDVIMVFKLTQKFRCLLYSFLLACVGLLLYLFLI